MDAIAKTTPTKGPWTVDPEYDFLVYGPKKDDRDSPYDLIADCRSFPPNQAVSRANALLISAAPEMLAELRKVLAYLIAEAGPDVEFIRLDNGHTLNVGSIQAVVAKAEASDTPLRSKTP